MIKKLICRLFGHSYTLMEFERCSHGREMSTKTCDICGYVEQSELCEMCLDDELNRRPKILYREIF